MKTRAFSLIMVLLAGRSAYADPGPPLADAAEQMRLASEAVPDEEAPNLGSVGPPMEASEADWREQGEDAGDFDPDDLDRRD